MVNPTWRKPARSRERRQDPATGNPYEADAIPNVTSGDPQVAWARRDRRSLNDRRRRSDVDEEGCLGRAHSQQKENRKITQYRFHSDSFMQVPRQANPRDQRDLGGADSPGASISGRTFTFLESGDFLHAVPRGEPRDAHTDERISGEFPTPGPTRRDRRPLHVAANRSRDEASPREQTPP